MAGWDDPNGKLSEEELKKRALPFGAVPERLEPKGDAQAENPPSATPTTPTTPPNVLFTDEERASGPLPGAAISEEHQGLLEFGVKVGWWVSIAAGAATLFYIGKGNPVTGAATIIGETSPWGGAWHERRRDAGAMKALQTDQKNASRAEFAAEKKAGQRGTGTGGDKGMKGSQRVSSLVEAGHLTEVEAEELWGKNWKNKVRKLDKLEDSIRYRKMMARFAEELAEVPVHPVRRAGRATKEGVVRAAGWSAEKIKAVYRDATAGSTAEEAAEVARIVKSGKYPTFPKGYRTVTPDKMIITPHPKGGFNVRKADVVSGGVHGEVTHPDLPDWDTRTVADIDEMAEGRKSIEKEQIKRGFDDPKKKVLKANTHDAVDQLAKYHDVEPPPKGKIKGKTQTVRMRLAALRRVVKQLITGPAAVVGAALPLVAKAAGPAGVGRVGGMNAYEEAVRAESPNYDFSAGKAARNTGAALLTDIGAAPYDLGALIPRGVNWAGEQLGAGKDWLPGMGMVRKADKFRGLAGRAMRYGAEYGFGNIGVDPNEFRESGEPSFGYLESMRERGYDTDVDPTGAPRRFESGFMVLTDEENAIRDEAARQRGLPGKIITDMTQSRIDASQGWNQPPPEFTRDPRNRQPYHGFKAPQMDRLSQQPTPAMPGLQPAAPSLGIRPSNKPVVGPPVPGLPGLLPPEV